MPDHCMLQYYCTLVFTRVRCHRQCSRDHATVCSYMVRLSYGTNLFYMVFIHLTKLEYGYIWFAPRLLKIYIARFICGRVYLIVAAHYIVWSLCERSGSNSSTKDSDTCVRRRISSLDFGKRTRVFNQVRWHFARPLCKLAITCS